MMIYITAQDTKGGTIIKSVSDNASITEVISIISELLKPFESVEDKIKVVIKAMAKSGANGFEKHDEVLINKDIIHLMLRLKGEDKSNFVQGSD